jgi:integrase
VRAALSAAVDDGHLPRNPCAARSVRPPTVDVRRIAPWTPERVFAVQAAMPERYQAMVDLGGGCGLRQGEIRGVAVDATDFESDTLHVVQQLKLSRSKAAFAPPDAHLMPSSQERTREALQRAHPHDQGNALLRGTCRTSQGKATANSPLPADNPQVGGLFGSAYFFLPWVWRARFLALVRGLVTPTDLRSTRRWWSLSVVVGRPRRCQRGSGTRPLRSDHRTLGM